MEDKEAINWAHNKQNDKEHVSFPTFVKKFNILNRESANKAYMSLITNPHIQLKRQKRLHAEYINFQQRHEETFWLNRDLDVADQILVVKSATAAKKAGAAIQDAGTREASLGLSRYPSELKPITSSSSATLGAPTHQHEDVTHINHSTTPPGSPSQAPLTLADHDAIENLEISSSPLSTTPPGSPPLAPLSLADLDVIENSEIPSSPQSTTSLPAVQITEPEDDSENLLNNERERLLQDVNEEGHPVCDWKIDNACIACLFSDYRRSCVEALAAHDITIADIADIMAIIGVFAPSMETTRMHDFFSSEQLIAISQSSIELPDLEIDDSKIMKAVRLYLKNKGDEAELPLIGNSKKSRLMLETL
ncbi:hypothetical protein BGZ76_006276 [Entomortierella beljakovae]|nr:hypothetical protein BGZ76_006276 [Entomortierella beljakovae]